MPSFAVLLKYSTRLLCGKLLSFVSAKRKNSNRLSLNLVMLMSSRIYKYSTVHNKRSYSNNHSYLNLQTKSIIVATGIIIPSGKKLGMNF